MVISIPGILKNLLGKLKTNENEPVGGLLLARILHDGDHMSSAFTLHHSPLDEVSVAFLNTT
jgi:hypothetical protein